MTFEAAVTGTFTIPEGGTVPALYACAGRGVPVSAPSTPQLEWVAAISDVCGIEQGEMHVTVNPGAGIEVDLYYHGEIDTWVETGVAALAQLGATGELDFVGEDSSRWKTILHEGISTDHQSERYYPTLPGDDCPVLFMTRRDVRACIAFLCGQDSEDKQAFLLRLTAALNE